MLKIPASEFGTVNMCRRTFPAVTPGVVRGLYKVVTRSCMMAAEGELRLLKVASP